MSLFFQFFFEIIDIKFHYDKSNHNTMFIFTISHKTMICVRRISDEKEKIYKISHSKSHSETILNEFKLYKRMSKITPCFKSFDEGFIVEYGNDTEIPFDDDIFTIDISAIRKQQDNIMLLCGPYNRSYVSFDKLISNNSIADNVSIMYEFTKVIDKYLHGNNFIHGDLKIDNFLYNPETKDFQIIDLEYSFVASEEQMFVTNKSPIWHYLEKQGIYNKSFLFLHDTLVLLMSFLFEYINSDNFNILYNEFFNVYETHKHQVNKTFLSMIVLLQTLMEIEFSLCEFYYMYDEKHYILDGSILSTIENLQRLFMYKCDNRDDDFIFSNHNDYLINVVVFNMYGKSFDGIPFDNCLSDSTDNSLTYSPN